MCHRSLDFFVHLGYILYRLEEIALEFSLLVLIYLLLFLHRHYSNDG